MKKGISLVLALLLLLTMASCGAKTAETAPATQVPETMQATVPAETAEATQPTETTPPAPTEPEWEPGTIRAGICEALYKTFSAGEEVEVIGRFRDYCVILGEDANLLVHRELLRMEGEAPFAAWDGYSRHGTEVFDNPYFRGEPFAILKTNTKLTVLESGGSWALVEWADGKGYVKADMLSKWQLTGGGGGKSNNDGTDVPVGSLTGADDSFLPRVHLLGAWFGPEMASDAEEGRAVVLADGTEGYLCLLERGDEVRITHRDEETATIWLGDGFYARIPRFLVAVEGDAPYTAWTGYVRSNSVIYGEYQLETEQDRLSFNKEVTVVDEVAGCYVVEFEGRTGYMLPEQVSEQKLTGGTGNSAPGSTWTPPKL